MNATKIADLEKNVQLLKEKRARIDEKLIALEAKIAAEKQSDKPE